MPSFESSIDSARLYYVDYIPARSPFAPPFQPTDQPSLYFTDKDTTLIFIHGWPMSHRMYEHLLLRLSQTHGVRCIASDRRGFGNSEWSGNKGYDKDITYQTFAQDTIDLLHVVRENGVRKFYFVGASMGCGETVLSYLSCSPELQQDCLGFVWMGPSAPYPLATETNPTAPSRELWDMILAGFRADSVAFVHASIGGVFGIPFNIGIELPESVLNKFEAIVAQADSLAIERCVQIISSTDLTENIRQLDRADVKILVIHGDSDQSKSFCFTALILLVD